MVISEVAVCEEHRHGTRMAVHVVFFAGTVVNMQDANMFILEYYSVVGGIGFHGVLSEANRSPR